ncbi:MAG: prolipoprotein diacylglyceryl transferase [Clostridiales bacterium]|jgi:phosphatidylglycerol:prolipoprotein diacylglycerol transferase|nr:prolipoprotein diacylglyceryl transferase [Clostridiales bacterium]
MLESILSAIPKRMLGPTAFEALGFSVKWYGIVIVFGMIVGLLLFTRLSKSVKLTSDDCISMFLVCIPAGIICARLGYVISHTSYYFPIATTAEFFELFAIWDGGVTIIGGIPGGVLGALVFAKVKKVKFLEVVGVASISLLLGQAIGRWANFFNQELYGPPVPEGATFFQQFPFGVYIENLLDPDAIGWHATEAGAWHYSAVLYESVLSFIGVALLLLLFRKVKHKGTVFFGYLAWYFISRALVESIREDAVFLGNMPISLGVLISLIIIPIAVLLGIIYYQNGSLKRLTFKKLDDDPDVVPLGEIFRRIGAFFKRLFAKITGKKIAEPSEKTTAETTTETTENRGIEPPETKASDSAASESAPQAAEAERLDEFKKKFYGGKK